MSYGLEVWDADGNKILSVTDRITRLHGIYPVPPYPGAGIPVEVAVPGLSNDGTWCVVLTDNATDLQIAPGKVVLRGGLLGSAWKPGTQLIVFRY